MFLVDFILHIDNHIFSMANQFGSWTYLFLFLIIFIETGAVIFPFLPGDSLLFAAGALAASPSVHFSLSLFLILFFFAAFLGDVCNFLIGHYLGYSLLKKPAIKHFIKPKHIAEAEAYFEAKGSLAIILARYIPIIRTFVPFVAGSSQYPFKEFVKRSFIAALSWSLIACGAGYFFGNIPFVKSHFSAIILGIVFITLLPSILTVLKSILKRS